MSRSPEIGVGLVPVGLHGLQRLLSSRRSWAALAAAASIDLSQQEADVLHLLRDGIERSLADLARLASMDAAAVSRQIRSLEKRGMVTRRVSPAHGRVVLATATDDGLDCAQRLHQLRTRHLADALADWSPEDRDSLGKLLVRLVDDLQRTPHRP